MGLMLAAHEGGGGGGGGGGVAPCTGCTLTLALSPHPCPADPTFFPGRCAEVVIGGGQVVGKLGVLG